MRYCVAIISVLLLLSAPAIAKEPIRTIEGMVLKVVDGDTIHVVDKRGTVVKVRLYGIDAPELEQRDNKTGKIVKNGQPFGDNAHEALLALLANQSVKLEVMSIDKNKQAVAIVYWNTQNINLRMVNDGMAWAYRPYLDKDRAAEYIAAEDKARTGQKGLWIQKNPQPPWLSRKGSKKGR